MMIELWHLILLLIAFFGACGAVGKLLLGQMQRHLDERFTSLETTRAAQHIQLSDRLNTLDEAIKTDAGQWQRVERELLNLKADLPLHYVRREDYVQAVATIMTKLDAIALRFENLLLKEGRNL